MISYQLRYAVKKMKRNNNLFYDMYLVPTDTICIYILNEYSIL